MAVLNIRIDDATRDALTSLAQTEGMTLSELVRDVLSEAVTPRTAEDGRTSGDAPVPDTMQLFERQTLSLLHRILGRVLPADSNDRDGDLQDQLMLAEILEEGFTGDYWRQTAGFATELSKLDSNRLFEILNMFRVAGASVKRLAQEGVDVPTRTQELLTFQGFDFNDDLEARLATYVDFLVRNDRWSELRPVLEALDGGNSHAPMLRTYLRMLGEYRRIMDSRPPGAAFDAYQMSADELQVVAGAASTGERR